MKISIEISKFPKNLRFWRMKSLTKSSNSKSLVKNPKISKKKSSKIWIFVAFFQVACPSYGQKHTHTHTHTHTQILTLNHTSHTQAQPQIRQILLPSICSYSLRFYCTISKLFRRFALFVPNLEIRKPCFCIYFGIIAMPSSGKLRDSSYIKL